MEFEVDESINEELDKHLHYITFESDLKSLRNTIGEIKLVINHREREIAKERGIIVQSVEELVENGVEIEEQMIGEYIPFKAYFNANTGRILGFACDTCDGIVKGAPKVKDITNQIFGSKPEQRYRCGFCNVVIGVTYLTGPTD